MDSEPFDVVDVADVEIRPETPADIPQVSSVNRSAFGSEAESKLVDRLRELVTPYVSLVAVLNGEVAGHIFLSPVRAERMPPGMLLMGLGPMAVRPDVQNNGIGSALVEQGLARCRHLGAAAVFVLGHADYYPRFGFVSAAARGFRYKNARYDPYFLVLELSDDVPASASGIVTYHAAFESV